MATLLPPPKRAKIHHSKPDDPTPSKTEEPTPAPNVIVQFVSEADGKSIAPAVNIPADLSREGLEALVNKLSEQDEDPVPFSFYVSLSVKDGDDNRSAPTRLTISSSVMKDVIQHPTGQFTTEDVLTVVCAPQSVFRVRPATRCSSTLSGMSFHTFRSLETVK